MISSLRRNLQSEMTDRLIDLAMEDQWMPRSIRTLAIAHLRDLRGKLGEILDGPDDGGVDDYTLVHLSDLERRIDKALNAVYITGNVRRYVGLGGFVYGF